MFTAISSAPLNIQLFSLENGVFAATGPTLARVTQGRLEAIQRVEVIGPSDIAGSAPTAPTTPMDILYLSGTWPESAWATVNLGWKGSGSGPGSPICAVPDHAVVRWNEARRVWVKQPDLNWVWPWPGGVIAGGLDGKYRWAEDPNRPVPAVLAEGVVGNGWSPPMLLCTTDAGDVFINIVQSPKYERGWWVFPRGQATGERLILPPDVDPHRLMVHSSRRPDVLYASATLESGELYLAVRTQGGWQRLPPPLLGQPEDRFRMDLFESSSGYLIASVHISATNETAFYKLASGSGWRSLPLKYPFTEKEVDQRMLVIGQDDDLWLSARFQGRNQSVLYHARL